MSNREYLSSHPWLTFELDLRRAPAELWIMLGECQSKCEHLAAVPLRPDVDRELHTVYLAKGVAATTAIEGNTLSEAQVRAQIEGKLTVPPSKEYLAQETGNILKACNLFLAELRRNDLPPLSPERIKDLNRMVLAGLQSGDERTKPGEFRTHSAGVWDYRGAPWEDCPYLVERLCEWLNSLTARPEQEILTAIIKAVIAHVYLAWIHPFGDGNGRTARLVEVQMLLASGVPSPAAQLLSNHYNQTRSEYYRQLGRASKSGGDITPFLLYAVQGFRDGLREQIAHVRNLQWDIAWLNYIHEQFEPVKSEADSRRKRLVIEFSKLDREVRVDEIVRVSAPIAADYAGKTPKTLTRDLNRLVQMGLLGRQGKTVWARKEVILAMLPVRAAAV